MDATVGHIEIVLGPMFSGKTTELIRRIRRYKHGNKRCLLIKYKNDTRYSEEMAATHDRQQEVARSTAKLQDLHHLLPEFDVVGIDEGQFFPDIVEFSEAAANTGKIVVIAALDGTFQRKPFGSVLSLIPMAEKVTKLSAVCMICYKDAAFTKRLGAELDIEVIGGADKYVSVCRACFRGTSSPAKRRIAEEEKQQAKNENP